MPDQIDWLRTQIQARRAVAMAATSGPWSVAWYERDDDPQDPENRLTTARIAAPDAIDPDGGRWVTPDVAQNLTDADAEHVMLNDPRATTARCDAELAILDEHPLYTRQASWDEEETICDRCRYDDGLDTYHYPCPTVLFVAQGYQHRAGYPFADVTASGN